MGLFSKSSSNTATIAPPVVAPGSKPAAADANGAAIVTPPAATGTTYSSPSMAPSARFEVVRPTQLNERQLYMQQLKVRIHQQLVERLDVQNLRTLPHDTVRSEVRVLIRELCQSEKG